MSGRRPARAPTIACQHATLGEDDRCAHCGAPAKQVVADLHARIGVLSDDLADEMREAAAFDRERP